MTTDHVTAAADAIKAAIAGHADLHQLAGALIEGIATTVAVLPVEQQGETAVETVRLLRDRFRAHGAI